MKSSNYVIYLKKRMDMGKCTSCILYINKIQQHTRKQPASLFCLNLQQQTNLCLTTSSILPTPPFPKKKEEKKCSSTES